MHEIKGRANESDYIKNHELCRCFYKFYLVEMSKR